MKILIIILSLLTYTNNALANEGIKVHAFNKEFNIPSNCDFFVRPSATAGETRFNCDFHSPFDPVVIHFQSREYCNIGILPKITNGSNINKTTNGIQYIEKINQLANGQPIIWRVITDQEVCIYATGLYAKNLDSVLNKLWKL